MKKTIFGFFLVFNSYILIAQSLTIVNDEFNINTQKWSEIVNDSMFARIENGSYVMDNKQVNRSEVSYRHIPVDTAKNFSISCSTTWINGETDYGYGLLWGGADINNYYAFEIASAGYYRFSRFFSEKSESIIHWTKSQYIKQKGINSFKIIKKDLLLEFYINEHKVDRYRYLSVFGDLIGFRIDHQQKILFDDFNVSYISNTYTDSTLTKGAFTDTRDGQSYKTVKMGNQLWMAENLRTTMYQNGDPISTTVPVTLDISSELTPKYQWNYYGEQNNVNIYGRLYTWHALTDSRNVCPAGWHLPSYQEWSELIELLGGRTVAGGVLKETDINHWKSPNKGASDKIGFSALPSGFRNADGKFADLGIGCYYWTSLENGSTTASYISMGYNVEWVGLVNFNKSVGIAVRCIKDN